MKKTDSTLPTRQQSPSSDQVQAFCPAVAKQHTPGIACYYRKTIRDLMLPYLPQTAPLPHCHQMIRPALDGSRMRNDSEVMSDSTYHYDVHLQWTGNLGVGTAGLKDFSRDGEFQSPGHPPVPVSADPKFMGATDRYNPEELLFAALANCHMLSFLYLCSRAGIVVTAYQDDARGERRAAPGQLGTLSGAVLRPRVSLADESRRPEADALHVNAHQMCLVAQSLKFPVRIEPVTP